MGSLCNISCPLATVDLSSTSWSHLRCARGSTWVDSTNTTVELGDRRSMCRRCTNLTDVVLEGRTYHWFCSLAKGPDLLSPGTLASGFPGLMFRDSGTGARLHTKCTVLCHAADTFNITSSFSVVCAADPTAYTTPDPGSGAPTNRWLTSTNTTFRDGDEVSLACPSESKFHPWEVTNSLTQTRPRATSR